MSVTIKSPREIELMREAGRILAITHEELGKALRPGMSTLDIDRLGEEIIRSHGCIPSFKNYNGYPASACVSVNDVVIHGIPGKRVLQEGDIVSVDVGAFLDGYHGDCCATFPCGKISPEAEELIAVTQQSFFEGIRYATEGHRLGDISHAIQQYVESHGFSVVREFVGHGIGTKMHESPEIPNYGPAGRGPRLLRGMTLAIEPMVNMGAPQIHILDDGWTVKTVDGKWAAHYENTICITDGEPEILTPLDASWEEFGWKL